MVAVLQSQGGNADCTLFAPPTPGSLLLLGVCAHAADGGQDIPTPSGWTAVSAIFRNEQPGWETALAAWSGRMFYKEADGSEQTVTNPATDADHAAMVYVECDAAGGIEILDTMLGWGPHPGTPASVPIPHGNRSADGWPVMDVGNGREVLFASFWYQTSDYFGNLVAVDQAEAEVGEVAGFAGYLECAIVVMPIASTAGGYRLTGSLIGFDNFPAFAMVAFGDGAPDPDPPDPTGGVVLDPTTVTPIPISDDIISWHITRGAGAEITAGATPGAATIVLKNSIEAGADSDDKYNPENDASPLIDYLRDGTGIHISVDATGVLSGDDPRGLFGGRTTDITVLPAPGATVAPTVEIVCEDALGWMGRTPVDVRYATGRSQRALREAILAAADETRLDLDNEILTMPLSSASGSALAALEELNKANGTRHFAKPADLPADWYTYVTRNRQYRLDGTSDFALSQLDDHVTGSGGWRLSADTVTNQQRATITPIKFTPSTFPVWTADPLPVNVTVARPLDVWVDFDDYVSNATVNSVRSGSTPTITLTPFGTRAHLTITVASGTCTFTTLGIDGSLARRLPNESHVADDLTSQALPRGVRAGSDISGETVGTLSSARGIAEHVVWRYATPQLRPQMVIENWIPDMFGIDLTDIVSYSSPQLGVTDRLFEVVGYDMAGNVAAGTPEAPVVHHVLTLVLQECRVQSDPGWFVLDASELDSADILAY